jgi:hypothetical protein
VVYLFYLSVAWDHHEKQAGAGGVQRLANSIAKLVIQVR